MGNITTSGAAAWKVGVGMSTSIPEGAWNNWISGAEAIINVHTRLNWSDDYAGMNDDFKFMVEDLASNIVAKKAIAFDMSGFQSRVAAETKLDVLTDEITKGLADLKEIKVQDFIK